MTSLAEIQNIIESEINNLNWSETSAKSLYAPAQYVLSLGGKRLRPSLLLLATELFGADPKGFVSPALGIEVFHNFTLLHDDVMDKAPIRRGKPTVHVKWNESVAVLSGDAMLIKAYQLMSSVDSKSLPKVLSLFSQTAMEVCEGQQLDMEFESRDNVTKDEYIEMIRLKTAVLIAASLKIGALLAGADTGDADALYEYGINVGLAFQLKDDLLDVYGDPETFGKQIGGDIKERKKTYMLISAFEKADESQKSRLSAELARNEVSVAGVTGLYDEIGVREVCECKMQECLDKALGSLKRVSVDVSALADLAHRLMNRNK